MKQRTVNGIPIQKIWEKLQTEFPASDVRRHPSTNKEYVPVEKIEERLNAVDSAVQDVFKRCAKRFGIARREKEANRQNAGGREQAQGRLLKVQVLETFKALPKGGAKVAVLHENRTFELVFWAVPWKKLQEKYGSEKGQGAA